MRWTLITSAQTRSPQWSVGKFLTMNLKQRASDSGTNPSASRWSRTPFPRVLFLHRKPLAGATSTFAWEKTYTRSNWKESELVRQARRHRMPGFRSSDSDSPYRYPTEFSITSDWIQTASTRTLVQTSANQSCVMPWKPCHAARQIRTVPAGATR